MTFFFLFFFLRARSKDSISSQLILKDIWHISLLNLISDSVFILLLIPLSSLALVDIIPIVRFI